MANFWDKKTPCWEMRECAKHVCKDCPAYLYPEKPCWETDGTLCDKVLGTKKTCEMCKVYRLYFFETR